MREADFRRAYAAMQQEVTVPEGLVERTLDAMRSADAVSSVGVAGAPRVPRRRAEGALARPAASRPSAASPAPAQPARKGRRARRLVTVAVVACVSLCLVLFSLVGPLLGGGPAGSQAAESLFAIKAYAATIDSVFEGAGGTPEDIIVFPLDTRTERYSAPSAADEVYSGALFTVEGEGIERVQATLSRGELYAYGVEDFLIADDPDKAEEAANWQPKVVGTGKHYKGYDVVRRLWDPEAPQDDPYAHVRTIKRLGPTIDVPVAEGEPDCWGLWLDVGVTTNVQVADGVWDTVVDLEAMEGETLTVTVQFADGTFQTQVIELHAGWFRSESVTGASGIADTLPAGAPCDTDQVASGDDLIHALYGTLASVSDEGHPYPLDDANRYADEVAPSKNDIASSLEFLGTTATVEGVPEAGAVYEAGETRSVWLGAVKEASPVEVVMSNMRCEVTDVLPSRFDLHGDTKVRAFQGNMEYMNKCRSITNHWSVDEAGRLNEGNSFVVVEFDAALPASADHESMLGEFGQVCRIDEAAGQTVFATAGVFAALDTGYHDPADPFDCAVMGRIRLRPGEANHIILAYIADDAVAQGDGLAFACPPPPLSAAGFVGEPPDVADLQLVRLR